MIQSLLSRGESSAACGEISFFNGNWRFTTILTRTLHLILFWISSIKSAPYFSNIHTNTNIFSAVSGPLNNISQPKFYINFSFSLCMVYVSTHLIFLDFIILMILQEVYKLWNFSLHNYTMYKFISVHWQDHFTHM